LNKRLSFGSHPFLLLELIVASSGPDLIFTYSRYEVAPPGLQEMAPRSDVLRVSASELTLNWVSERFAELGPTEELAWHSLVEYRGSNFHIPMIDFVNQPTHCELQRIGNELKAEMKLNNQFFFYDTGRSFHGYSPTLIPEHAWSKYFGRLLVFNKRDHLPVIDSRWVGHALLRGFAALRWSHNTSRYQAIPGLVSSSGFSNSSLVEPGVARNKGELFNLTR